MAEPSRDSGVLETGQVHGEILSLGVKEREREIQGSDKHRLSS